MRGRHEEIQEEDGRTKVIKFEFLSSHFFDLVPLLIFHFGPSTNFVLWFSSFLICDSSSTLSNRFICRIINYHVILRLSHTYTYL